MCRPSRRADTQVRPYQATPTLTLPPLRGRGKDGARAHQIEPGGDQGTLEELGLEAQLLLS